MKINSFVRFKDKFIPISEASQIVSDERYIEGVIEIFIQDSPILTIKHEDYIDQLWSYIWEGIKAISENRSFSTFFPGQPIELLFELKNYEKIQFIVKDDKVNKKVVDKNLFIKEMTLKCKEFFHVLPKIAPTLTNYSKEILEEIDSKNFLQ